MRSFYRRIRRTILIGIVLAVVLGLFGLGYIILGVQGQRLGDQYRTILSRINGSVSYINQLRVALTDSSEMITSASAAEELQARYQAVQDELDTGAGLFSGIRVPSPPQLPYTLLELQSAIEALGDTARQIGASYQSLQNRLFRYSVVLTTIGFLIMLGFITAAVYLRRFVAGFITYIHEGGEHLRAIIAHDNAPPPMHEPLWQEEFRYREIITSLEQVVSRERELSESIPTMPLEEFLPMLQDMIRPIVDFNRIAFAFTDRLGNVIADSAITSAEYVFLAPGFVEPLADTTLGEIVRSGKGRIIPDLSRHYLEVNQSRSTRQLLEEGVRSSMTIPFLFNGTCIGFLFLSSNEPDQFRPEHLSAVNQLVQVYKRSLYYQYLLQQVVAETSDAFVRLMEKKDNETSLHILRMAQYSHIIAQEYLR
ncbi:MAG: GAF domain-containing protein, partial [Spirochaeta sp.]